MLPSMTCVLQLKARWLVHAVFYDNANDSPKLNSILGMLMYIVCSSGPSILQSAGQTLTKPHRAFAACALALSVTLLNPF